jgi:hypothetical protein
MAVKKISVDLEAYEVLSRRKRPGRSFSREDQGTLTSPQYRPMDNIRLSEETLGSIKAQIKYRGNDPAGIIDALINLDANFR